MGFVNLRCRDTSARSQRANRRDRPLPGAFEGQKYSIVHTLIRPRMNVSSSTQVLLQ
jgi:hypothetical protein